MPPAKSQMVGVADSNKRPQAFQKQIMTYLESASCALDVLTFLVLHRPGLKPYPSFFTSALYAFTSRM